MRNSDIREEVLRAGLHLWQVAEALGVADSSFSRKLRHELAEKEKAQIRMIISEIKEEELENNRK